MNHYLACEIPFIFLSFCNQSLQDAWATFTACCQTDLKLLWSEGPNHRTGQPRRGLMQTNIHLLTKWSSSLGDNPCTHRKAALWIIGLRQNQCNRQKFVPLLVVDWSLNTSFQKTSIRSIDSLHTLEARCPLETTSIHQPPPLLW